MIIIETIKKLSDQNLHFPMSYDNFAKKLDNVNWGVDLKIVFIICNGPGGHKITFFYILGFVLP